MRARAAAIILKGGLAGLLGLIAWTVVASLVFLWGTGLFHAFPHPFWQWWLYFLEVHGEPQVDLWLKIGALAGVLPPLSLIVGLVVRGQQFPGGRLRRPLFGGPVNSPKAVTDNHGRAHWMSMARATQCFPGPDALYGGIVVGEAYRVDQDRVAKLPFDPRNSRSWGQGGKARLLIDPCHSGPTHSLVIAGAGSFKSMSAISTLLTWRGSAVVLDPAGEMAPMVRAARQAMGHTVHELDLGGTVGFNVLDWIDITSPLADTHVLSVAAWICGEELERKSGTAQFFEAKGRHLVICLLSHMLWDDTLPPAMKTLACLRHGLAVPIDTMREVLKAIHASSKSAVARDYAGALMQQVPETFAGIYGSADKDSAWLANKAFAALVSGNSFRSTALLRGDVSIFLKMPLEALDTTPALARTIIGALLNTAYQANGALEGRILYLLDEVARLGYMRIIETARDAGRKFGITMQLLYQSTGQIVKQWGPEGKKAWYDGVSHRTYAVVQDIETATELEDSFGHYGVMATSEGVNSGSAGKALELSSLSRGKHLSVHEISRPLIRKAELMNAVRSDEAFIVVRGQPPLRCGRAIYFRRPEMVAQVVANRFYQDAV
ncbi:MAG: type IV secretory system conjugative DNA transfer family protein [Betaproteobacteria bacterium]|nr:type IV secretory system conjugative DNA transfer family protein [Betaproteobacteria bacterium]